MEQRKHTGLPVKREDIRVGAVLLRTDSGNPYVKRGEKRTIVKIDAGSPAFDGGTMTFKEEPNNPYRYDDEYLKNWTLVLPGFVTPSLDFNPATGQDN